MRSVGGTIFIHALRSVGGIPEFVLRNHDVRRGSADRFGCSWEKISALSAEQEEQFRRWTIHIDSSEGWRGKRFLDVGCGIGRSSYWVMTYGAAGGTATDMDKRSFEPARPKPPTTVERTPFGSESLACACHRFRRSGKRQGETN